MGRAGEGKWMSKGYGVCGEGSLEYLMALYLSQYAYMVCYLPHTT